MVRMHNASPTPPSRIVLLNATGFVGSWLKQTLGERYKVVSVSSKDIDLTAAGSAEKLGSLLQKGDALVFSAALTPDKGRDLSTLVKNLEMTVNVTKAAKSAGLSQMVYVSSDAVYDDNATETIRETSPCNPGTFHGAMHVTREIALKASSKEGAYPLTILRPSAIYGAGDTHNGYGPNRFLAAARKDGKIGLFGEGEEKRDHLYIGDLCWLVEQCLLRKTEGTLNVVSGKAVPFREAAEVAAKLVGPSVKVEGSPRQNPVTHRHFDTTALMAAFPNFPATQIADGMKKQANSL